MRPSRRPPAGAYIRGVRWIEPLAIAEESDRLSPTDLQATRADRARTTVLTARL